ncbi:hypothetical protein OESDEN_21902, partial [Oesophagostomum dentatum]
LSASLHPGTTVPLIVTTTSPAPTILVANRKGLEAPMVNWPNFRTFSIFTALFKGNEVVQVVQSACQRCVQHKMEIQIYNCLGIDNVKDNSNSRQDDSPSSKGNEYQLLLGSSLR